jgi:hypothetical protein
MNIRTTRYVNTLPTPLRPAWIAFGIWLRVVIVGVGVLATAVGLLLERNGAPAKALLLLAAGAALTALAWHRTSRALRRITCATASTDPTPAEKPFAASERPIVAA